MESEIIRKARIFAINAHGDQIYGLDSPYLTHLEMVASTLRDFGYSDDELIASAYLHDTIEDTAVSYQDIKKEFGKDIAEIVFCVTDELGRNRRERHEKTYVKTKTNEKAVILKLADRIANSTFSNKQGGDKLDMYKKEQAYFKEILFDGKNLQMWIKLDELLG
jgi:GTP pyrophosphokinase